ncbi:hypothetical protein B296_00013485 [Ensete ventricosum]|uniref:Uncharacterized protein n=1 Tax=Ensete ventricosum TaxID=4639 RepID=A0A427AVM8_ENSVE|nr:hypothetical protein B296_00013485 [Ensete ventricosum]
MKGVQAGVERFLSRLAVESAQRDSGHKYKRNPTQAVRSRRMLMLSKGCHFDAGSSADLVELSCKIRPFLGWWVPREISPTIKLELFRKVKSGVSCSDAGASFSFD